MQRSILTTYKAVVLSTAHITKEDSWYLTYLARNGENQIAARESGFFIKLLIEQDERGIIDVEASLDTTKDIMTQLSQSVFDCIKVALDAGASLLELDKDADRIDALPIYDW